MSTTSSLFKFASEPISVPRAKALDKLAAKINDRGTPFNAQDMREALKILRPWSEEQVSNALIPRLHLPMSISSSLQVEPSQSQPPQSQPPQPQPRLTQDYLYAHDSLYSSGPNARARQPRMDTLHEDSASPGSLYPRRVSTGVYDNSGEMPETVCTLQPEEAPDMHQPEYDAPPFEGTTEVVETVYQSPQPEALGGAVERVEPRGQTSTMEVSEGNPPTWRPTGDLLNVTIFFRDIGKEGTQDLVNLLYRGTTKSKAKAFKPDASQPFADQLHVWREQRLTMKNTAEKRRLNADTRPRAEIPEELDLESLSLRSRSVKRQRRE